MLFRRLLLPFTVVLGVAGTGRLLWWAGRGALADVQGSEPARFDDLIAVVTAAAGGVVLGWVALALLATALSALPGAAGAAADALAGRVTPAAARRAARLVVGLGVAAAPLAAAPVAAGLPGPVTATAAAARSVEAGPGTGNGTLAALPGVGRPQAAAGAAATAPAAAPVEPAAPSGPAAGEVLVRRGDTLWDLAAAHLRPGASDAEIAGAWPRWYAANRDTIGPDPDLLLPGTVLLAPGPVTAPR